VPVTPSRPRVRRTRLAASLLALVAVFLSGQLLVYSIGRWATSSHVDAVSRHEARLRSLRAVLPARGEVGYVASGADPVGRLYLAQYALAPVVLRPGAERELVVVDADDAMPAARLAASGRFDVVRDFGAGLVLLRRRAG
jgi:hypothetical protein